MNKLRILLCSPIGLSGGISKWTENICSYYSSLRDDNIELSCKYPKSDQEVIASTPFIARVLIGIKNYIPVINLIKKEARINHYDIIQISSSASISLIKDLLIIGIAHRLQSKAIVHFHFGRIPIIFSRKGWEKLLIERVLKAADGIIVIDKSSYNTLIENEFKNVFQLQNPLSEQVWRKSNEYNPIKKEREILFVGHVVASKGVFELVKACKQIESCKLRIVGFGSNETINQLKEIAGEDYREWLAFTGAVSFEEVIEDMKQCAVFALPTYSEGFPNVIIESMACGCPIVTTDVGAIPEMLDIENGDNYGICVKPKQVKELRNAISKMLDDREFAISCGKNAQKRVKDLYSMPKVWEKMALIWKEVVESN